MDRRRRRVVVTGMGMATPVGLDVESTWEALREGRGGVGPVTRFDASHFATRIVAELKNFDLARDLGDRGLRQVNCEGGPGLLAALVRAGVLDELLLTVSPLLVGGDDPLTMLHGDLGGDGPHGLELRGTWRGGDVLFLHYHLTHGSPA